MPAKAPVNKGVPTWTSKMTKIMDPILPTVCILRYWAIICALLGVQVDPIKSNIMSFWAVFFIGSGLFFGNLWGPAGPQSMYNDGVPVAHSPTPRKRVR